MLLILKLWQAARTFVNFHVHPRFAPRPTIRHILTPGFLLPQRSKGSIHNGQFGCTHISDVHTRSHRECVGVVFVLCGHRPLFASGFAASALNASKAAGSSSCTPAVSNTRSRAAPGPRSSFAASALPFGARL
eukprot:57380-Prorocentrum_minimum.AAC.3